MPAGGTIGAKRASHTRSANLRHQAEAHLVETMGARKAARVLGGGGRHLPAPKTREKKMMLGPGHALAAAFGRKAA